MQSFRAIIRFALFLSDWFIAHSNALKGLNTLYKRVRLHSPSEKPGLRGFCCSAQRPYRRFSADSCVSSLFFQSHTVPFTSQQPVLQKLVPKCQGFLQNTGRNTLLLYRLAGRASSATPRNLTIPYNFTPPMQSLLPTTNHKNYGQWEKETHKTETNARVLTSVYLLSYHSLKLLLNSV